MSGLSSPGAAGEGWTRRRLLQSAAAAAAVSFWRWEGAAEESAAVAVPVSVGYVLGSEELPDVARPAWWTSFRAASAVRASRRPVALQTAGGPVEVMPAADLLGDPRLAVVPVRVAVLGLYPEIDDVPGVTYDLVLTVHFVTGDPAIPELPFYAWGWRDDPAPSSGSPTRFTVPVERDSGLRLTLDVRQVRRAGLGIERRGGGGGLGATRAGAAVAAETSRRDVPFTVNLESGVPRLQRGIYLLALEPGTWERPRELPAGALPSEIGPSVVIAIDAVEETDEAASESAAVS